MRAATQLQLKARQGTCTFVVRAFRAPRAPYVTSYCSNLQQDHNKYGRAKQGPLDAALRRAGETWSRLDNQQRVYTVAAGAALLAVSPAVLTLVLVPLERLLVGALLAVEEVLAAALLGSARLVALAGLAAFVVAGLYLFLFKREPRA